VEPDALGPRPSTMLARTVLLVAAMAGLAACTSGGSAAGPSEQPTVAPSIPSDGTSVPTLVKLTEGDACGDAFFWAATTSGDIAVVVRVDAHSRSKSVSTFYPLNEDDLSQVSVLQGEHLDRNFCTDLIVGNWEPTSRQRVVAGTGEVGLAPAAGSQGCGATQGTLNLQGLIAEDGTRFAPIRVESQNIGCVAG
jgi:hypothetical protein